MLRSGVGSKWKIEGVGADAIVCVKQALCLLKESPCIWMKDVSISASTSFSMQGTSIARSNSCKKDT